MRLPTKFTFLIIKTIVFVFAGSFIFTGCGDCMQRADGIILDRETKSQLDSVSITTVDILKNTVPGSVVYSLKNGQFKFSKISGGLGQCPDLTLYFFKWGFKQTSLTFKSYTTNDTVYLDRK